jgi:phenylacetate-CoA ligase
LIESEAEVCLPNLFRLPYYLVGAMRRANWRPERLREFQEKKLRCVIRHAFNSVPFYHRKFRAAGISPDDIKTLDDLKKLPIITQDEFRSEPFSERVSSKFAADKLRTVQTSGSTGKPLKICLTAAESDWRKAIYMRANILCGQSPRDRWVAITAPHHFGAVPRWQRILGLYSQTCLSVFDDLDKHVDFICRFKPHVLDGYSGVLTLLAQEANKTKLNFQPKLVFGNADLIDYSSRRYLEDVFGAPYCDQFGCAEVNRTAWNCLERDGYHMDVDSVIFEFTDENGDSVSAGECGEIVYTSLFNFAMPLIRYSVGDLGVPSDDLCSCGLKLPLMKIVEGRKDSVVVLPDGRLISPRLFTIAMGMFRFYNSIEQFRVLQKKPDFFEIYLKMNDSNLDYELVQRELVEHLIRTLNVDKLDLIFDVKFVDAVPLGKCGKRMAVVSEVNLA